MADQAKDSDSRHLSKKRDIEQKRKIFKREKRPSLPRPKRSITFSLSQTLLDSQASSPAIPGSPAALARTKDERSRSSTLNNHRATIGDESPLLRLHRINVLLNAIHRRNKNQHRNQPFYRHLSFLRRSVNKLTDLHEQSAAIANPTKASTTARYATTAALTRERFEKESRLRSQREMLEEHIRETVIPSAYVAFSGVVADTQFANLGIVLLGILSDVAGVVGLMRRIDPVERISRVKDKSRHTTRGQIGGRLLGLSTVVTGPDQGKVIERIYDSDNDGFVVESTVSDQRPQQLYDEMAIDVGEVVSRDDFSQSIARGGGVSNIAVALERAGDKEEEVTEVKGDLITGLDEDEDEKEEETRTAREVELRINPFPASATAAATGAANPNGIEIMSRLPDQKYTNTKSPDLSSSASSHTKANSRKTKNQTNLSEERHSSSSTSTIPADAGKIQTSTSLLGRATTSCDPSTSKPPKQKPSSSSTSTDANKESKSKKEKPSLLTSSSSVAKVKPTERETTQNRSKAKDVAKPPDKKKEKAKPKITTKKSTAIEQPFVGFD